MEVTGYFVRLQDTLVDYRFVNLNAVAEADFHLEGKELVARVRYIGGGGERGDGVVTFRGPLAEELRATLQESMRRPTR